MSKKKTEVVSEAPAAIGGTGERVDVQLDRVSPITFVDRDDPGVVWLRLPVPELGPGVNARTSIQAHLHESQQRTLMRLMFGLLDLRVMSTTGPERLANSGAGVVKVILDQIRKAAEKNTGAGA